MSNTTHSNLVMANRSILAGDVLSSTGMTTTKQYFQSKRTIPANASPADAVWKMRVFGSFKTLSLAPTINLNLEVNRAVVATLALPFGPIANLTKQGWGMDFLLTKGDANLLVNGEAKMGIAVNGPLVTYPMMGGNISPVDWTQQIDVEVSVSFSAIALGGGSTITLEQMVWEEARAL